MTIQSTPVSTAAPSVAIPSAARRAPAPPALSWSLCRNCGEEYYPSDIPANLRDVGPYGTCTDCREEAAADMMAWARGGAA